MIETLKTNLFGIKLSSQSSTYIFVDPLLVLGDIRVDHGVFTRNQIISTSKESIDGVLHN